MDRMDYDKPPAWARTWCFFYMVSAALMALTALMTLLVLATSYDTIVKSKGGVGVVVLYVLALGFQSVTAMVTFWMCRSALK